MYERYGLNAHIPWCPIIPRTPPATVVETCSTPYPHFMLTIYFYIDQTISLTYILLPFVSYFLFPH